MNTTNKKSPFISTKNFNKFQNKYAIRKTKEGYRIVYGHFFNDINMFIYTDIPSKNSKITNNALHQEYFRTSIDNILKNKYNEYYFFTNYEDIYNLWKTL